MYMKKQHFKVGRTYKGRKFGKEPRGYFAPSYVDENGKKQLGCYMPSETSAIYAIDRLNPPDIKDMEGFVEKYGDSKQIFSVVPGPYDAGLTEEHRAVCKNAVTFGRAGIPTCPIILREGERVIVEQRIGEYVLMRFLPNDAKAWIQDSEYTKKYFAVISKAQLKREAEDGA